METEPVLDSDAMRASSFRLWMLSVLSALLQLVPFPLAGPVPVWRRMFCWFCLAPLLMALLGEDRRGRVLSVWQGTLLGYLCGVLWFAGNCYWVYQTMHLYGGMPEPVAAGILLLFSLYLGLYMALFGAVFVWLRRRLGATWVLCLTPFLWVAVELARARVTSFPWDLLGYTQVDNSLLTAMAPVTGVMGLSFVIAAVNAAWMWRRPGQGKAGFPLGAVGAMLVATLLTVAGWKLSPRGVAGLPDSAVLLQDNLNVGAERGPRELPLAMYGSFAQWSLHPLVEIQGSDEPSYAPALGGPRPELILWPEAPTDFVSSDPMFRQQAGAVAKQAGAAVIADSVSNRDETGAPRNFVSASFFDAEGNYAGRYDKMHLVPFGEFVPYRQIFFFAGHLLDGLDFVPGRTRNLFRTGGHSYGVFICYESVFGDEVREFAKNGAQVLVNLSDDGWYGDTSAPWEHLDMARMRAIENRRWVLRATNTGLTTAIDPAGNLREQLPRHERAALLVHFAYVDGTTFYTRYGDWLAWGCVVVCAGAAALAWRRPRVRIPLGRAVAVGGSVRR